MSKFKVARTGLLGTAAALAVFATAPAKAVEADFGDVHLVFDTTISVGASVRTAERNAQFLSEGNGGPIDPRDDVGAGGVIALTNSLVPDLTPFPATGRFRQTLNPDNYDGGVNGDDGRLNWNQGDLIGANVKANHDFIATWNNYKVFARAVGFYDFILSQEDAGERSILNDKAIGAVGRNYQLLDAFVSADYTIADMPVNIRVGKQVINWGESTFTLNGNNVFNPIDVASFRRPGSEIKEALIPVNAVFASVSLPFDVSLSGYYALNWQKFKLDPSGSPFSGADVVADGSGLGGNVGRVSFLTGSPYSGERRTCGYGAFGNTALNNTIGIYNIGGSGFGLLRDPNVAQAGSLDCLDSPFVNSSVPYTIGKHEATKLGLITTLGSEGVTRIGQGVLSHDNDDKPKADEFGLSTKIYAEDLGGTEFGFYYQKYNSRLPFVAENSRVGEVHVGATPSSFQLATGQAGRFALPTGCLIDSSAGTFLDPRFSAGLLGNVPVGDPENILNSNAAAAALSLGITLYNNPNPAIGLHNMLAMSQLNCALILTQSGTSPVTGRPTLFDGAEVLSYGSDLGLFIEYPEGINEYGFSFNTTLGGWGLQGDFTYRPEAPFQVDTDSITIAASAAACAFPPGTADLASTFEALNTYANTSCFAGGAPGGNRRISGVLKNEMFTGTIGTTATFTASDWWVDALGADLGVLVTETGFVFVPGVEKTWLDKYDPDGFGAASPTKLFQQYQNTGCQGSDLPLGGLLGLDRKSSKQCRPTDFSSGLVLLTRLEYNDAFGSGFSIAPQLVYTWDFAGTTPSPYGNYMKDRQSLGLNITGTLNNNFRLGASYSAFFGGHINNKAKDQDFASVSASYAF